MNKLVMCRGLPASGKSMWAAHQVIEVDKDIVIVDSDIIREKLGGYSREFNTLVRIEKFSLIRKALRQGKTVISTDPNLLPTDESALRDLASRCKAKFEIKEFDTPLEECIKRDSVREKRVGEKAIRYWNDRWQSSYHKD